MTTTPTPSLTTHDLTGTAVGPFPTQWTYDAASDVTVRLSTPFAVGDPLTPGVDFTLTGATPQANGGTVLLSVALVPPGGWAPETKIVLRRVTQRRQATALPDIEGHRPRATERALDKQMRIAEEDRDDLSRALTVPPGEVAPDLAPKALRADRIAGFDANGDLGGSARTLTEFDEGLIAAEVASQMAQQAATNINAAIAAALLRTAVFETLAAAVAVEIPETYGAVQLLGRLTLGDGGRAIYVRVVGAPVHAGAFQSADGAYWEIAEDTLYPEQFGAQDITVAPSANQTAAIQALGDCASRLARPIRARSRKYRVSEAAFVVRTALDVDDIQFREHAPNTSDTRRTIIFNPATPGVGRLRLGLGVVVDRAGDGTRGALNYAAGLWVQDVPIVVIGADVFGNGKGSGIVIDNAGLVMHETSRVHDMHSADEAATDDDLHGVWHRNCRSVTGVGHVARLGRMDQTTDRRDVYSRGFAFSNCDRISMKVFVDRVDQAVDVTGGGGNDGFDFSGSVVSNIRSAGYKFANTAVGNAVRGATAIQCGLCAVLISGPSVQIANLTRDNLVTGIIARNIGTNGKWTNTSIVKLDRNGSGAPLGAYPKGTAITGNKGVSDQGATTFVRTDAAQLTLAAGIPIQTGVRVRLTTTGALPGGLATATDYWLIDVPDTDRIKLASSYINALDGVAVALANAGTGVHTITLQSDCDWGVYSNVDLYDKDAPNEVWSNSFSGMRQGAVSPLVQALTASGWGLPRNISANAATPILFDFEDDVYALLEPTTGVFTCPRDGQLEFMPDVVWDSVATGFRQVWMQKDTGSSWVDVLGTVHRIQANDGLLSMGRQFILPVKKGERYRAMVQHSRTDGGVVQLSVRLVRFRYTDRD